MAIGVPLKRAKLTCVISALISEQCLGQAFSLEVSKKDIRRDGLANLRSGSGVDCFFCAIIQIVI